MPLWAESSARIFARLHGVVEMGRFDQVDAVEYLIVCNGVESRCNANGVLVDL